MHRLSTAAIVSSACACICTCVFGCRHPRDGYTAPGVAYPPEAPAVETHPMATRDLGAVAADACDSAPLVSAVEPNCERIVGRAATGSDPTTSANAFDGNTCTAWNAGGDAPRFIAVDFGQMREMEGVVLVGDGTAVGTFKHVIESSDEGEKWTVAYVIEGQTAGSRAYWIPFQNAVTARYLRVTTEKSTTPIAWREILPLHCARPIDK